MAGFVSETGPDVTHRTPNGQGAQQIGAGMHLKPAGVLAEPHKPCMAEAQAQVAVCEGQFEAHICAHGFDADAARAFAELVRGHQDKAMKKQEKSEG